MCKGVSRDGVHGSVMELMLLLTLFDCNICPPSVPLLTQLGVGLVGVTGCGVQE